MLPAFFTLKEYVKYRFRAVGAHGLHSPFLFDLYNSVIKKKKDRNLERSLLNLRKKITSTKQVVAFRDPKTKQEKTTRIDRLAKNVTSTHKFSYFLVRLINHHHYKTVLETGTSLGINTMYLAHSNAGYITTIEGSKEIATIAKNNFKENNLGQIKLVVGSVQELFGNTLHSTQPELIFLDADHRSETIDFYLNEIKQIEPRVKCIVVHDIYWSPDMKRSWLQIIENREYNLTIDLFQAGIIFPNYPIEKQHFTIKF